mgnify:CR=1 FL=1
MENLKIVKKWALENCPAIRDDYDLYDTEFAQMPDDIYRLAGSPVSQHPLTAGVELRRISVIVRRFNGEDHFPEIFFVA